MSACAFAHDGGLAERHRVVAVRHFARRMLRPGLHRAIVAAVERAVIDALGLEEDHRIVVFDGADQQALGVVRRRRDHRLQAGDVREQRFRALAVRLAAEDAAAIGRAHRDRRGEIAGRAIAQARGFADELVVGRIHVVGELDLDHGPQAVRGHADGGGDDAALADRRVEAALGAVLLLQAVGDAEDAAEIADVLAEGEHVGIARHHDVERGVERLDHGHRWPWRQTPCSSRCWRRCQGMSL